ncbi:MAG: acyl carrier protein [Candidatus Marinimicrobia bacterium]|nr:acyl carrier protein [Candidatus Neomarinimicrobiota bacterium]
MSTLDRIKSVCVELLKVEAGRVQDSSRFVEDLGADSMQSIELVAAFEEEFDIEMDEDAALGVKTVADAVTFIDRVIAEG